MKKQKVLFVLQSLRAGGSASSLVNLVEELKNADLDVKVFLMEKEGMYLERCEKSVNVLQEELLISSVVCDRKKLKDKCLFSFLIRILYSLITKVANENKVNNWIYKRSAKKLQGFDVVIAFQEELVTEYSQYIECKKRIAWCHTAFDKFVHNRSISLMKKIYSKYDNVVCVSEVSKVSMIKNLDIELNKIQVIHNVLSIDHIKSRSELSDNIPIKDSEYVFVSMGRMVPVKRFDRIIDASVNLRHDNMDFKWYVIGDGEKKEELKHLACKKNISEMVIFVGQQENPYPWIKNADLFIMTSESEAQPMSINEALILGIPIVTTDFPSSREVVLDGYNGLIVSNNATGVYKGIKEYIENKSLQKKLSDGAKEFTYDNKRIVNKIGELIDA